MSKQCPHCKSYNTELSTSGNIEYVAKGLGRGIVMAGGYLFGSIAGPAGSMAAGKAMQKNTESWTEDVKRYHCCNCGKDFK